MNIDELYEMLDEVSINDKRGLYHLIDAIECWPMEIETINEYFLKIKFFLSIDEIDLSKIKIRLKNIKVKDNLWNLESVSELICFLDITSPKIIKQIFESPASASL